MSKQEQVNYFLDDLRDSGATNMFGAVPHIVEEFGFSRQEAQQYLVNWMQTFEERYPQ